MTARDNQFPASKSGGQASYSKSFDQLAPTGSHLTSTAVIKDPQDLNYVTRVNGEVRQKTSTSDMIWSFKQIVAHLTKGTTLRAGTCIMRGTPSGIEYFMQPQGFLKDGDVMEVEIEKIGVLRNRMVVE